MVRDARSALLTMRVSRHSKAPRTLVPAANPDHIAPMKKSPFRLTPYQVQFISSVGFVPGGYALYLPSLAVELSTVARACDAGLQTMLCKSRTLATYLSKN